MRITPAERFLNLLTPVYIKADSLPYQGRWIFCRFRQKRRKGGNPSKPPVFGGFFVFNASKSKNFRTIIVKGVLFMKKLLKITAFLICVMLLLSACGKKNILPPEDEPYDAKPVIYLYPEAETEVSVKLDYSGKFTSTYPEYNGGWKVTAMPDGTLFDENGREYYCLFWEGVSKAEYDFSKGFCVPGDETMEFLEEALQKLGLSPKEANEFIIYWLSRMQGNEYNLISFQTDAYTDSAKLSIEPEQDTLIRVFMAWKPLDEFVEIEPQELSAPERKGFAAVEWGGAELK